MSTNFVTVTRRTKLRVKYAERSALFQRTDKSMSDTTSETLRSRSTTEDEKKVAALVSGASSTFPKTCERCRGKMIGRVVEDYSCLTCGWVPSTPEQDSWLDVLAEMNEEARSRGGFKCEPRMVGTSR